MAGDSSNDTSTDHGTIEEPPNSTVDDWFGQNAARDQELADEIVEEEGGDTGAAEERFDEEAEGQEKYEAGHPRP
ncbi:MAG TPA: hypothetical protein VIR58_13675 [Acidimicrobiales bacterium]